MSSTAATIERRGVELDPIVRSDQQQHAARLAGEAHKEGFVPVRSTAALNQILEREKAAVVIDRLAFAEARFNDFPVLALQGGGQQQIEQAKENCRTYGEEGGVAQAEAKGETAGQTLKPV